MSSISHSMCCLIALLLHIAAASESDNPSLTTLDREETTPRMPRKSRVDIARAEQAQAIRLQLEKAKKDATRKLEAHHAREMTRMKAQNHGGQHSSPPTTGITQKERAPRSSLATPRTMSAASPILVILAPITFSCCLLLVPVLLAKSTETKDDTVYVDTDDCTFNDWDHLPVDCGSDNKL